MDHYFTNNQNLKSEIRTLSYNYNNITIVFFSDNGVFSKNHLDYGSRLLIETFLKNESDYENILDLGCGYGLIGISLAKITGKNITMCDVNKRALNLYERNIDENKVNAKVIKSNVYENILDKYDVIITNPPIKAGKKVILEFLINAKIHLNVGGRLWFVIHKDQGAKSIQKLLNEHYNVEIKEKDKGFYIFCCKIS